jgi:hypothetical protein
VGSRRRGRLTVFRCAEYVQPEATICRYCGQVGTRTGATTSGAATTYNVAPGSQPGPVVQVGATWDQRSAVSYPQKLIGT